MQTHGARLVVAELALAMVSLVVALGFGRLFDSGGWELPLVATTIAAHITGAVMRRLRIQTAVQVAATALVTFLVMTWTQAADTVRYLLPTADTLSTFGAAFDEALTLYPEARAPTAPTTGFILSAMIGLAIAVLMSDIAAFRLRSEIQALLPPLTLFVFCSLLGSGEYRMQSAIAFAVATLMFVLVTRSYITGSGSMWLPADGSRGPHSLVKAGAGLTATVAVLAMAVTPTLPGVDDEALFTWRGGGGPGQRFVVSPLIDIRSRMVDQPSTIAFTVRSPAASYWRMMALDSFDGDAFRMEASFRPVRSNLTRANNHDSRVVNQEFTLDSLASPYLPAAATAVRIDTDGEPVRWDDGSSTLLLDRDSPPRGFRYQVESVMGDFEPERLRAAPSMITSSVRERYLSLPDLDPEVLELASTIVEGAASPYDQALALQNHLRSFEYSLNVPSGHSGSALARFLLVDRAGYCEQFAAAFAAMARSVGLPARVAVGFTVGEESRTRPGTYVVRGEHAHAWPEVWFNGVGWVPFEPTPGRADPQSARHTGVAPQEAGPTPTSSTTTTVAGTRPSTTLDPNMLPSFPEPAGGSVSRPDSGSTLPYPLKVALVVLAAVASWILLVRALVVGGRKRREQRAADDPAAIMVTTWGHIIDTARSIGLVPRAAETHREFARRLLGRVDHPDPGGLARLAEQAAAARFGPAPDSDLEASVAVAAVTEEALRQARTRRQRVVDLIDIRRAWPRRRQLSARRRASLALSQFDLR